ncbi:MAG: LamG-like jellyroll fold domain-containing protein [Candidatus Woesearchaeota archaeon]|nr:LamG-like jellyroll fold domain-containing protein [Candidatus Woesearchaeota archaeon]
MQKRDIIFVILAMIVLFLTGCGKTGQAAFFGTETDSSLVLYLPFDEGSGLITKDLSGHGRNGTLAGEGWFEGKYGVAVDFNTARKVDVGSFSFLAENQPFSIAAWVNPSYYPPSGNVWRIASRMYDYGDKLGDWSFNLESTGQIAWAIRDTTNSYWHYLRSNSVMSSNTWSYFIGVFNGTHMILYTNGALDAIVGANHGNDFSNTNNVVVGNIHYEPYERYFRGLIDEVRIYNKALSTSEIQQLYGAANITPEKTVNVSTNASQNATNITCTDSDGGLNYYVKGTLTISNNSGYLTDSCQLKDNSYVSTNQCSGSNCYLEEAFCDSTSKSYRTFPADYYNCPNGCQDGACLLGNVELIGQKLYSPDLVNVEFKVDMYSYPPVETTLPTAGYRGYYDVYTETYEDYSTNPYRTEWTSSGRFYKNDTYPQTKNITSGYYNGSLYGPAIRQGKHYRFDFYFQETPWGSYNYSKFFIKTIEFDTANITCTDSDGGMNYYVRGFVNGIWSDGDFANNQSDVCGGTILNEYYCNKNISNYVLTSVYTCTNGCSDGACINATPAIKCKDSDGGKDYYVTGNVTQSGQTYQDACINPTRLREGYCQNDSYTVAVYGCPNGCGNGACLTVKRTVNCTTTSIIGDANGDRTITPGDALLITNIVQGIEAAPFNKCCVDVDNNGVISQNDSVMAFNYYLKQAPYGNAGKKCYEVTQGRSLLAKTGKAFGFDETASSGAFGLILLVIILVTIYLLIKTERNKLKKEIKGQRKQEPK